MGKIMNMGVCLVRKIMTTICDETPNIYENIHETLMKIKRYTSTIYVLFHWKNIMKILNS